MGFFPIFLEMSLRPCLVIGGGAVAERKVEALLGVGAQISVISPELTRLLRLRLDEGKINHTEREYHAGDLDGYEIAFVATDDAKINGAVAEEGRRLGVWINAADDPSHCDFILPSVLKRGDLTVAVGTGGASPAVSRVVREEIEDNLGQEFAVLTRLAAEVRQELRSGSRSPGAEAWHKALKGTIRRMIREGDVDRAREHLREQLKQSCESEPEVKVEGVSPLAAGKVYIVGSGPGNRELLTVRALELLRKADVVVYDRLVNLVLIEEVPASAARIFVGKQSGHHSLPQDEINQVLIAQGRLGRRVVRLKGGDPFVFGRGGEEARALAEAGIPFEVVPGVSSVVAVPAYAGIPLTYRNVSSSFAVITGHEAIKSVPSVNWAGLATAVDTLVVVMGLSNLPHIVAQLLTHGRSPGTPIALIRSGTTDDQETVTGTLADICEKASGLRPPVLAVIGEVVHLRDELCWFNELGALVGRKGLFDGIRPQIQS